MRTMKTMMALAALCVLASGVQAKPQPVPETGTLIVLRMWHLTGCGTSLRVYVDDKLVVKLKNGYYCKLELPVGDHILKHEGLIGRDPQRIHIEAGKTLYFYNQMTFVSWIFEVAEDQGEAQQKVSGLKEQK